MMRFSNHKSFTLIEVLLVCALFSLAGVMIYYSFSNGLRLWKRAQVVQKEEAIHMFLDKMGQDLRQTLYFSRIKFDGQENAVSFACFVTMPADPGSSRADEGIINQIGSVVYEFNALEKTVIRKQGGYGQAVNHTLTRSPVDLSEIDSLKFTFIYNGAEGYDRRPTAREVVPSVVEVELSYLDAYNTRKVIHRLFPIPVGI